MLIYKINITLKEKLFEYKFEDSSLDNIVLSIVNDIPKYYALLILLKPWDEYLDKFVDDEYSYEWIQKSISSM